MVDITQFGNLNYTFIAILSSLFAAIANILARTLLKDISTKDILGINFLIMSATLLLFSPSFYYFKVTPYSLFLLLTIAAIDLIANYFYFKSFENAEASIVTPLLSITPMFAFFFGWMLIGDAVSIKQLLLGTAIVGLIIYFSFDFSKKTKLTGESKGILYAIIASLLFGLSAIPSKILLSKLEAINPLSLYMLRGAIIGLLAIMIFKVDLSKITPSHFRIIVVRGLFVITQWALLYFALFKGKVGVSITLANITPIFVFILSIIFLKEKPTWKKALAAAMVLVLSFML
ncbi:DMT family transporter [Candidatus Woesearchaeota archaeon]|nr:DMT family transporter [Candidatus Woesearchaeota archaeon]